MNNNKDFVLDIANKAGKIMKDNFSLSMNKEWKDDGSPLTITDKFVNKLVIEEINKKFPDHSVLGEEESNLKNSEYTWVCDPVDGTIPFSHGYPTFVFSLALTKNGESIMGVIYDPILDRLAFAEKNGGAYLNGKKIYVSKQNNFSNKSLIEFGGDHIYKNIRYKLIKKGCYVPTLYSALYSSLLVACGEFAAQIFCFSNPWDGAATKIIVEEAGGKVTDLQGNEQRYDSKINGYVASNGLLHEELIKLLSEEQVENEG